MNTTKRIGRRLLGLMVCLFTAACCCLFTLAWDDDSMVRVGLSYGSSVQPAFNVLSDKGYRVGYFDGDRFVEMGRLGTRYVAFCRDTTLYTNGRTVSTTSSQGATAFKPYHLEVEYDFDSVEEALSFIDEVRDAGYNDEIFPVFRQGEFRVRINHYSAEQYAEEDQEAMSEYLPFGSLSVVGPSRDVITVLDLNEISIAAQIVPPSGTWPAVRAMDGGAMKRGLYTYNGAFEMRRLSGGDITFLNTLSLADYLKGVLPYEMDGAWPLEALKAQAVCARSYLLSNLNKHKDFDICNTTHCQVYYGTAKETARVRQAVEETRDEVLAYQGKTVSAFYFSSSGGYTESAHNVWGGDTAPYCAAVPDPYEDQSAITHFSKTVTRSELTSLISSWGTGIDRVADCYVSTYTEPAHNVYAVTFVGENGKRYTISGCDNVRIKLSSLVKSPRFDITGGSQGGETLYAAGGEKLPSGPLTVITGSDELVESPSKPYVMTENGLVLAKGSASGGGGSSFTFAGSGLGHNVGMSQFGAKGMAERDMDYEEILHHYFTDIRISSLS
ncbi:MAG: SpoIID/LytB domain-containing protein [Clostridia bacterium]|nr:SpoIID/LytB domain-containing protein [Clostridia bacterium]